jgi:aminoglycoside phosphotransferase (APT) family kinase protein
MKLSNQLSYVHKDLNRKNVLWNDMDFRIIDWETSTIDNPSIDFFNSAWFLTNDIEEDKFKVFIKEYFSIMKLEDDFEISAKASIIEECNWLAFSLRRALRLITEDEYEVNLGLDSIASSLKEILNYYSKIDLMLKYLNEK